MKDFRYYSDPETGDPHIYDHDVSEDEVEEVFAGRRKEDHPGRDDSRVLMGQTSAGRYLKVIYVPDEDRVGIFVITAYDLRGKPLRAFRSRMKRRFG